VIIKAKSAVIAGLLLGSLLSGLITTPTNAAAPKPGSSCSKVGLKSVASGKTYKCVKVGKKLNWSKGTVNPITNPIVKSATDDFKRYTANIRNSQGVKVVAQAGVDPQLIKWVQEGANYVAQRFEYPKLSRSFVDFIGIDKAWLESSYIAEGFSSEYSRFRGQEFCSGNPACGGKDSNVWNFTVIKNENLLIRDKVGMAQTPAHEFFHAVQENLAGTSGNAAGTDFPNWFWEGPATFVGVQTAGILGFIDYSTAGRDAMMQRYKYGNAINRTSNLSELKANDGVSDPYAIGFAATELLVSQVGMEKLISVYAEIGTGKNFDAAFEQATGMKLSDFYLSFEKARASLGFPKD
jgi:hypothetical protein